MPVSQCLVPAYNAVYWGVFPQKALYALWNKIYYHVLLQVMCFLASLLTNFKNNASEPPQTNLQTVTQAADSYAMCLFISFLNETAECYWLSANFKDNLL